jgi:hypothetical protein
MLWEETAALLKLLSIRSRIHKLMFTAQDTFGAIGELNILKQEFDLAPDVIFGICYSLPLVLGELSEFTDTPVFNKIN